MSVVMICLSKELAQSDGDYRLAYAVTATQKEILKAFDMTATNIREQAIGINEDLRRCEGVK